MVIPVIFSHLTTDAMFPTFPAHFMLKRIKFSVQKLIADGTRFLAIQDRIQMVRLKDWKVVAIILNHPAYFGLNLITRWVRVRDHWMRYKNPCRGLTWRICLWSYPGDLMLGLRWHWRLLPLSVSPPSLPLHRYLQTSVRVLQCNVNLFYFKLDVKITQCDVSQASQTTFLIKRCPTRKLITSIQSVTSLSHWSNHHCNTVDIIWMG